MQATRYHVSRRPLTGTDDTIVRVSVDRAEPRIGGLWIEFRSGIDHPLTIWEAHRDAGWLLAPDTLRAAAQRDLRRVQVQ
jgi:hypothetical protein